MSPPSNIYRELYEKGLACSKVFWRVRNRQTDKIKWHTLTVRVYRQRCVRDETSKKRRCFDYLVVMSYIAADYTIEHWDFIGKSRLEHYRHLTHLPIF